MIDQETQIIDETPVLAVETPTDPEKQPDPVETDPVKQPSYAKASDGRPEPEQPKPDYVENAKERNMRALREKAERYEQELHEATRRLKEYESKKTVIPEESSEEDLNLDLRPDELAEGKHLSKVDRKIKRLEEKLSAYQAQNAQMTVETRLKSEYPDFDSVVTSNNIKELTSAHPELALALQSTNDLYAKAVTAYTMIRKLGISIDDNTLKERAIVHKNAAKPRPLTSIAPQQADSPLSQANAFADELTEDRKKALWQEMVELTK